MSKTKEQILYDHGIDIGRINDDFNTQLLHAMERYAESFAASREEGLKGKLLTVRNKLYDAVPVGNVGAFDVIKVVKEHLSELDKLIDESPTSPTPGNSERMAELENENVELREVVRQLNAGMIHFSTLDKMPTLDLLDRKAVIAHVVNIGKKKVINPKDTNQPYYSDSERMEKETIGFAEWCPIKYTRLASDEWIIHHEAQKRFTTQELYAEYLKSKPMDKEGEK